MIRSLLILIVCWPCIAFSQTEDSYKPPNAVSLNATQGEDLMKQCSRSTPDVKKFWNLTKTDSDLLEEYFNKLLSIRSKDGNRIINLRNYAYQYLGVTIGKKNFIYINAFQLKANKSPEEVHPTWKTSPVTACDGGSMFWGALFNLETKEFSQLTFNGGK
ncbi:MAG: hypothetical protein ACXWCZ_04245 [Flavisolibacter sp.]